MQSERFRSRSLLSVPRRVPRESPREEDEDEGGGGSRTSPGVVRVRNNVKG